MIDAIVQANDLKDQGNHAFKRVRESRLPIPLHDVSPAVDAAAAAPLDDSELTKNACIEAEFFSPAIKLSRSKCHAILIQQD
jgi:hypothetical protein